MAWFSVFFRNKRITLAGAFALFCLATVVLSLLPDRSGTAALTGTVAGVVGIILAWRGARSLIRQSIWRLRNRLIVTYIFIGVVPLVLVLILVLVGGYIFAGQTAMYLVSSELDRTLAFLSLPGHLLAEHPGEPLGSLLGQAAPLLSQKFPALEVVTQANGKITHYPLASQLAPSAATPDFNGITVRNGAYYAWSHAKYGELQVDAVAPLSNAMLANLVPHLGKVDLSGGSGRLLRAAPLSDQQNRHDDANDVPAPANQFDWEVTWPAAREMRDFNSGDKLDSSFLVISTRPFALMNALFGDKFSLAIGILYLLVGIAFLFLLVEIVSLMIGVSLTRTITGAMQNLYNGTRQVSEGDFSHRIEVKGKDQLAAVAESFNSMTERLERLVVVEKEKERLQSEIEIAREVQNQLFPRSSPKMKTIEVFGLCQPARMVSGDYYDFLCLQDDSMALAVGDVAGKGISAALLMASIQSIMRTQLTSLTPALAATANGAPQIVYSTSSMVARLNQQLYQNTSPEKYATFMFGVYEERDQSFTYTNAGHLPPILIRRGESQMLEVTGTVVGAFPACVYAEQKIHLEAGDLLVSYTDGITEPENEYGEEFGAGRLVETLLKHHRLGTEELINRVMEAVRNWTTAPELPDDMTVVLARRIA